MQSAHVLTCWRRTLENEFNVRSAQARVPVVQEYF